MQRPDDYKNMLFVGRITEWKENMAMPKGSALYALAVLVELVITEVWLQH